jgi:REP element-mobilizing transposase RayT
MAAFGFVIMPNHVHFIWQMNKRNGKEKPFGSFLKYTAHQLKKVIKPSELENYKLNAANKSHKFWQRDSLAIELYSPKVAIKS